MGIVEISADVRKKRKCAYSSVVQAPIIKDQRVSSNGRVPEASSVEQQGYSANCGIGIRIANGSRVVEGLRAGAYTGIVAVDRIEIERIPAGLCVSLGSFK